MSNVFNSTGAFCVRDGVLCEHNLSDAPMIRKNVCSGIGGVCINGNRFAFPTKTSDYDNETPLGQQYLDGFDDGDLT